MPILWWKFNQNCVGYKKMSMYKTNWSEKIIIIFRTIQKWEKMWVCLITSTIYWRLICRCRRHHTHKLDVMCTVSLHDNDNREWRRKQQRHRQRQRQCPTTIGSYDSRCVCCRCSANGIYMQKPHWYGLVASHSSISGRQYRYIRIDRLSYQRHSLYFVRTQIPGNHQMLRLKCFFFSFKHKNCWMFFLNAPLPPIHRCLL